MVEHAEMVGHEDETLAFVKVVQSVYPNSNPGNEEDKEAPDPSAGMLHPPGRIKD